MIARGLVFGLAMLLTALATSCTRLAPVSSTPRLQASVSDLDRAVAIATSATEREGHPIQEYTLISAQQVVRKGRYIWRITFKPNRLLPEDPSKELIGLGGELFVNVDLSSQKTVISYGE